MSWALLGPLCVLICAWDFLSLGVLRVETSRLLKVKNRKLRDRKRKFWVRPVNGPVDSSHHTSSLKHVSPTRTSQTPTHSTFKSVLHDVTYVLIESVAFSFLSVCLGCHIVTHPPPLQETIGLW